MSKVQARRRLLLAFLTLFLITALPLASAQVPHLAEHPLGIIADHDDSDVTPITETRQVRFDISVECPRPSIETQLQDHVLTFAIESNASWAQATLDKTVDFIGFTADECLLGAKKSLQVIASIVFNGDAPAFELATFYFTAAIDSGQKETHSFDLRAGFYERWQARFETTIVNTGPGQIVQVPLTLENHGNGDIRIHFEVDEQTSSALMVAPVGDQIVRSLIAGGETDIVTIPFDVRAPDEIGRRDMMVIDVSGSSVIDPSILLSPIQVNAVVETTESGNETAATMEELPGLAPLSILFVLFVALASRRH